MPPYTSPNSLNNTTDGSIPNDPVEQLTNNLLKMAKYAKTRRFEMKTDPTYNRKQFDYFFYDINNICSLSSETHHLASP